MDKLLSLKEQYAEACDKATLFYKSHITSNGTLMGVDRGEYDRLAWRIMEIQKEIKKLESEQGKNATATSPEELGAATKKVEEIERAQNAQINTEMVSSYAVKADSIIPDVTLGTITGVRYDGSEVKVAVPSTDMPPKDDPVSHPSHYNYGGIETIDAIEAWGLGFNLGNVVKYVSRAGHKDDIVQDLRKAEFYLNREIKRLEKNA